MPHRATWRRLDAALYDPAPPRSLRKVGQPHVKGARQPSLTERLGDPKTERQAVGVGRLRHRLAATSKAQAIAYALAFQASDNTAIQELSAVFGDKSIVTCI